MKDLTKLGNRRKKPIIIIFFALLFVAFVTAVIVVVMTLWNALLPEILGVKSITFWQAAGILLLSKILFGGFGGSRNSWKSRSKRKMGEKWKSKWIDMKPEERDEMKNRWKSYCEKKEDSE